MRNELPKEKKIAVLVNDAGDALAIRSDRPCSTVRMTAGIVELPSKLLCMVPCNKRCAIVPTQG